MPRSRTTSRTSGAGAPSSDDVLEYWKVGDISEETTPGSSVIRWRCTGAGRGGVWEPIYGVAGGAVTLRAAYLQGAAALDQTLPLSDADGGGVILDGSGVGFTGALSLRVNSAAAGPFVVDRANGYVGIGQVTPTAPLEVAGANGSNTAILLSRSAAHQRIEKTSTGGLSVVIPNTANPTTNYMDFVIGSTSKIRLEAGGAGGSNGVITFNNSGTWAGTLAHWATGETIITGTAVSGSSLSIFSVTAGALTNQNASVELSDVVFNLSHTVQQVGGVNHASNRAFKILAPTYTATSSLNVPDLNTVYIDGAPAAGTNMTGTIQKSALWIGAGNGGGIRTDGFGASGLIKNNNGGLWTLGVAGTDYVAPWSLTNQSFVISAGGSALTEDNPDAYYIVAKSRAHFLGQTVMGSTVGFWLAGAPYAPTLTFASEDFDATETSGPYRDTGFFGVADNMFAATVGGLAVATFSSQGIATYGLQARYLMGGTENGRTDGSALVIRGGASTTLAGLTFDASAPFSATSGTQRAVYLSYLGYAGGFAPTSGTAGMRYVDLEYEVNQTGGANGTVYGLRISATRTAEVGAHYGLRVGDTATSVLRADPGIVGGNTLVYVGEPATGITGWAGIRFDTNARQAYLYVENPTGNLLIAHPQFAVTGLAAGGMVKANATTGQLAIASSADMSTTLALGGPAVVWTNVSGVLSVDTARFTYDSTNFSVRVPNGTVSNPSWTPIGDTNTGAYSYAADVLGFSTGGRHTFRVTSDSSSRYAYVGESGTGISGWAWMQWETNARAGAVYLDNAVGNVLFSTVGWCYPNGSAAGPSIAFTNSADTGAYRYGAGVYGIAAAGRHVIRFASDSTSRYAYLGETGVTSLAYLEFVTASRGGAIYVDNAQSLNALIATERMWGPNGTAANPTWSYTNSNNTGRYRYAAGVEGVAADGRHTARFSSDSSSRFLYIGESATGIAGYAWLGLETNARASAWYVDNAVGNVMICTTMIRVQNDTAIGLSRTSPGILSVDGTSVDVPSLNSGGMVKAAATTGRLSIATPEVDFVKKPDEQVHLSYGLDRQGITGSAKEHYGTLRTVAEGVPQFWLTPMCGENTAFVDGTHSASNAIEWPLQREHTHIAASIYVYSNTYGGTLTFEITVDGTLTGASVTVPASTTGNYYITAAAYATGTANRLGLKVTQSTNASGYLVCTASVMAMNV